MDLKGKKDEYTGKAKEKIADVTNDEDLHAKGEAQEGKGKAHQAGHKVKETAKDIGDTLKK